MVPENAKMLRHDEIKKIPKELKRIECRADINTSDNKRMIVDKSLFIKYVLEHKSKALAILRPRGFGKTMNLLFLKTFLTNTKQHQDDDFFRSFKIGSIDNGKYLKYRDEYSVLFLSFSSMSEHCSISQYEFTELFNRMFAANFKKTNNLLHLASGERSYRKKYDPIVWKEWLTQCIDLIKKNTNKKIIFLIDSLDKPLLYAYRNNYLRGMKAFYDLFIPSLKSNPNIDKIIMMGTHLIPQLVSSDIVIDSVFSDNGFGDCFGFLEEELRYCLESVVEEKSEEIFNHIKESVGLYQYREKKLFVPSQVIDFQEHIHTKNKLPFDSKEFVRAVAEEESDLYHLLFILKESYFDDEWEKLFREKSLPVNVNPASALFPIQGRLSSNKIKNILLMIGYFNLSTDKTLTFSNTIYQYFAESYVSVIHSRIRTNKDKIYIENLIERETKKLKLKIKKEKIFLFFLALAFGLFMKKNNFSDALMILACGCMLSKYVFNTTFDIRIRNLPHRDQIYIKSMPYHTKISESCHPYISRESTLAELLEEIKKELSYLSEKKEIKDYLKRQAKQEKAVAFLSGLHPRLGESSPLGGNSFFKNPLFDKNVIGTIFDFVGSEAKSSLSIASKR